MPRKIRTLSVVALGIMLAACNVSIFQNGVAVLSNINGATLAVGPSGSTVILVGAGFGDTQGAGRVLFTPIAGGIALVATVTSWTQAAIVTSVPTGALGTYVVSVQTGGGQVSAGRLFEAMPAAPFNASAVTWAAGPTLPAAVSGAGVAFADIGGTGFIYAVGGAGAGGAPVTTVSYAAVATNGTLGPWTDATPLPAALAFPGVVAATQRNSSVVSAGYLYALGGTTSAGGTPVSTVYRAPLNANGSIGAWTSTGVTALPASLRSVGAVIAYGSMYVIGGATTGNATVATVYRSPIQVTGNLNSWLTQGALPAGRARAGFGALGLYLYVVGGESDAVAPNDTSPSTGRSNTVYFAKLNPSTRDIATSWTTTTALPAPRSALSAVFGINNVLVTGGLYPGAVANSSEEISAPVNADGTIDPFTAATPGTSIASLCGCSLFNHGATGYLAGDGSFHVVVVGGDNAAAVGTRRAETFVY